MSFAVIPSTSPFLWFGVIRDGSTSLSNKWWVSICSVIWCSVFSFSYLSLYFLLLTCYLLLLNFCYIRGDFLVCGFPFRVTRGFEIFLLQEWFLPNVTSVEPEGQPSSFQEFQLLSRFKISKFFSVRGGICDFPRARTLKLASWPHFQQGIQDRHFRVNISTKAWVPCATQISVLHQDCF